jgi:secretion/DNA translocation related CpaE-like protein
MHAWHRTLPAMRVTWSALGGDSPRQDSSTLRRLRVAPGAAATGGLAAHLGGRIGAMGFIGGSGGVGASIVAAGTAVRAAASGQRCLLIDLDPRGGGIDILLGLESAAGHRWDDLRDVRGVIDPVAIRPLVHPRMEALHVLASSRTRQPGDAVPVEAIDAVFSALLPVYDLIVVDLPRHGASPALMRTLDHLFLVSGVDVRACAAGAQMASALRADGLDARVIVRGPGPVPHDAVQVADFLGLPLAGEVLWEPRLARDIEDGRAPGDRPRGQVAVGCDLLLASLTAPIPRRRHIA